MMKFKISSLQFLQTILVAIVAFTLAGCVTGANESDRAENNKECQHKNHEGVCFPDRKSSWLQDTSGKYLDPYLVRAMRPGMTKDDVQQTISYPHFKEGFFGVREWNYLFKFRTADSGSDYLLCQYQVKFDENYRVKSTHWLDRECETFIRPVVVPVPIAVKEKPAEPTKPAKEVINLDADALFAFGKSDLNNMNLQGKEKLEALAKHLHENYVTVESIFVIGHTDPLGSESFNQKLSEARATTVRNYLIRNGFSPKIIVEKGVAAEQMVKKCATTLPQQALIDCNQANRRVSVEVQGFRK